MASIVLRCAEDVREAPTLADALGAFDAFFSTRGELPCTAEVVEALDAAVEALCGACRASEDRTAATLFDGAFRSFLRSASDGTAGRGAGAVGAELLSILQGARHLSAGAASRDGGATAAGEANGRRAAAALAASCRGLLFERARFQAALAGVEALRRESPRDAAEDFCDRLQRDLRAFPSRLQRVLQRRTPEWLFFGPFWDGVAGHAASAFAAADFSAGAAAPLAVLQAALSAGAAGAVGAQLASQGGALGPEAFAALFEGLSEAHGEAILEALPSQEGAATAAAVAAALSSLSPSESPKLRRLCRFAQDRLPFDRPLATAARDRLLRAMAAQDV